ncbi:MAG: hypothetical protein ACRED3_11470 [Bradyrhizobium sp.]
MNAKGYRIVGPTLRDDSIGRTGERTRSRANPAAANNTFDEGEFAISVNYVNGLSLTLNDSLLLVRPWNDAFDDL